MSVWAGRTVAVIGGDARETEIAALAVEAGATVRVFGTPGVDVGRPAGERAPTLADALDGAQIVIGPIPLPGPDGRIFAPSAPEPIHLDAGVLRRMRAPAHVVIGKADERLHAAAREAGVTVHEYEHDTELMLLRAPAIAEGAIREAIARSPVTIHASPIGVVGFGRTGRVLARSLVALGGRVHVFARRAEARAEAYALGAEPHPLDGAPEILPRLDILFNTVPERVLTRDVLRHLPAGALVIDTSAPPGGVDGEAAAELGLSFVWARGLGASAPRTVARSQWMGVTRIVKGALGARA